MCREQAVSGVLGTKADSRTSERQLLQEAKQVRAGVGVNKKSPMCRRGACCGCHGVDRLKGRAKCEGSTPA